MSVETITTEGPRRNFLRGASFMAFSALAGSVVPLRGVRAEVAPAAITDADILNFALNLEYLEAEFYLRAAYGITLHPDEISGTGRLGGVTGGHVVPWKTKAIKGFAEEIAHDERAHVQFLRKNLGSAKVARPDIDFANSFNALAAAAGLPTPFDPFGDEMSFLLGAFVFEDVGVTAYSGAAPLIASKAYLAAAAGILSTEAYHAGGIRALLYFNDMYTETAAIASLRAKLDGTNSDDMGVAAKGPPDAPSTIADVDPHTALAYARTPGQVLNIVYASPSGSKGGFFPKGVNGTIS
jgi:hypothetical protein